MREGMVRDLTPEERERFFPPLQLPALTTEGADDE